MKSKQRSSTILSAFHVFNTKKKSKVEPEAGCSKSEEVSYKPAKKRKLESVQIEEIVEEDQNCESENPVKEDENNEAVCESEDSDVPDDLMSEIVPCGNYAADKTFKWLMTGINVDDFFEDIWEKKPLFIKRENCDFYKGLLSCDDFHKMMIENALEYNTNIDITSYTNGERKTLSPEGRVYASVVWDFYQLGCSVRFRNPQAYHKPLWKLCSLLQEYFGSYCGVNMYLTPPGNQGFAPHFDDIEAFVLQLEGKKLWRVYAPRNKKEILPYNSSPNFTQDEIGLPLMEQLMEPGDLLYFPRGYIHQAKTEDDIHSLHVTISTYKNNTWGDLLALALPMALKRAMEENVEFRQSLPKDYLDYMGLANTNNESPERYEFMNKVISLGKAVARNLMIDAVADQHAKDFIHGSLPPFLNKRERKCSVHGDGYGWKGGRLINTIPLTENTKIRLLRKRICRLVREDGIVKIFHSIENSRDHKGIDLRYADADTETMAAFELLQHSYPAFIKIENLPFDDTESKMAFSRDMYNFGFLMTKEPLLCLDD